MTDFPPGYVPPPDPGYPRLTPGYALPRLRARPGRIWYLVAVAMIAAGIAWLVVGIVSLVGMVDGMPRVALPGGGTVTLTHSGGYTIYYEGPDAGSGFVPSFNVNVTPASPGAAVSGLKQFGSSMTYQIGSRQGAAVLTMNVTSPGRFRVTTTGAPNAGADLAFGGSIGSGILGALLPAIPLMVLGILGLVILLIIRSTRRRALRRGYA